MTTLSSREKSRLVHREFIVGYSDLRRKFIKFNPIQLIGHIHAYINERAGIKDGSDLKKQPWDQLLLIKWILLNSNFSKNYKHNVTRNQSISVMKKAWSLASKKRLLGDIPDVHIFMRPIVFQQLNYQKPFSYSEFGRQIILFEKLPIDHRFHRQFFEETGFTIKEYLTYTFCLIVYVQGGKSISFSLETFSFLESELGMTKMSKYLDVVSLELSELCDWLKNHDKSRSPMEYLLDTPLYEYPIFKYENNYFVWHPAILYRQAETFIYDKMKSIDPGEFMNKFGSRFEEYIAESISKTNTKYLREDEIKPFLKGDKCIDFVISEGNDVIFMDAKATEVKTYEKITQSSSSIQDRIKGNILKAIEQAYSVYSHLDEFSENLNLTSDKVTPYILVVTYKEYFIGNGITLFHSIAKDKIQAIQAKYSSVNIPLENIYCITIDNFDMMTEQVRLGNLKYTDILKEAIKADSDNSTKCYCFDIHLSKQKIGGMPDWIYKENKALLSDVMILYKKK